MSVLLSKADQHATGRHHLEWIVTMLNSPYRLCNTATLMPKRCNSGLRGNIYPVVPYEPSNSMDYMYRMRKKSSLT
jgi:hypothetical protein